MLTGDNTSPSEDLGEELIERNLHAIPHFRLMVVIGHNVDMDVPVARVAEGRDGKAMTGLELGGEFRKINQPAALDDNVLVEFR